MAKNDSWTDTHRIPSPSAGAAKVTDTPTVDWAGFKNGVNQRISELFKTEAGLPGHVLQIQQELNRIDRAVDENRLERTIAKALALEIYRNCATAARAAQLTQWDKFTLRVETAGQYFECEKQDGVLKLKPSGI
jgi:hypothetical protein